ncbi:LysR family transcriptional regulator [Thalassococcus sp. CAU 1522]|uniref:LysR family transcriptional regulator n=1 Tax=Thalassococcus arenae TaxID=2851652 RepID=A0ABS6NB31_9RHOB|nr:LysR family transcriptional regulator [Thalassococcus arenae]MBV2361188.1 LysR family transcriptional regulator [Thalassococcus arenae]
MSQINLDQLNAFLHVVRLGGVTKAAEALHLTQPAVTARIRNLEASIGAALFDRHGGGLRLTKRGEMLLGYAEQFERLTGLVQRDITAPEGVEGRLRLGVSETIAQCWLPDLIYRLHGLYPRLEIELHVDISINLRAALLDRALDLAVLLGPVSEFSVDNVDLPGFDLAWYVSAKAPARSDPAGHLQRPVLTYARQTRPYRELKKLLQDHIGPGVTLFPSSSLSACFRLVEADLGVAALPRALGRDFVAKGTIREFDPGWVPPPLHFTASYLADPHSPMIETAARMAREVARDYA